MKQEPPALTWYPRKRAAYLITFAIGMLLAIGLIEAYAYVRHGESPDFSSYAGYWRGFLIVIPVVMLMPYKIKK